MAPAPGSAGPHRRPRARPSCSATSTSTVEPGRCSPLLGPNGAGKTTLLLTLAGLLPAPGRHVAVDGAALRNGNPRGRQPRRRRARPRQPVAVHDADGRGEPRGRPRPAAARRRGPARRVPGAREALAAAGRRAVGRRAADAGHGPGAHPAAQGAARRRDEHGPGAARRRGAVRDGPPDRRPTTAPPSCSSSSTSTSRSTSPTRPPCSTAAPSSCGARRTSCADLKTLEHAYLGELEVAR